MGLWGGQEEQRSAVARNLDAISTTLRSHKVVRGTEAKMEHCVTNSSDTSRAGREAQQT